MRFSKLACHAVWLVPNDRERIRRFVDGLTYQLQLLMTWERVSGATFDEVVDIVQQIEMVRSQERGEREAKRPHGSGDFSGVPSGFSFTAAEVDFTGTLRRVVQFTMVHYPTMVHIVIIRANYLSMKYQLRVHLMHLQFRAHRHRVHLADILVLGALSSPPPPFTGKGCFKCGDIGHIKRYCPRLTGGPVQQRSQPTTSAPVISPPTQPAQGGAQLVRGHPRGGGQSSGGQARSYVILAKPDVVASDAVITDYHTKTVTLAMLEFPRIE
ncbi:uncharacterized protein [Nicotiana tomentosiformis]|uniref:uncharacterized protein n=1 Tax=Nicotiana tomentosiformis TaxID=4098 RepID=UPI00388C821E